jgi:hypothetical protein
MHPGTTGARPERAGPDRVNAAAVRLVVADALARSSDTQQITFVVHEVRRFHQMNQHPSTP